MSFSTSAMFSSVISSFTAKHFLRIHDSLDRGFESHISLSSQQQLYFLLQTALRNHPANSVLERIQKRALRIIFPYARYNSALKESGIPSLYDRRASLSSDLFTDIVFDINHKLAGLLPPKAVHHRQLRSNRKFNVPVCRTDGLKKSFIVSHSLRM